MEWKKVLGFFERENKNVASTEPVFGLDAVAFEDAYRNWLIEDCSFLTTVPIGPFTNFPILTDLYCQHKLQAFDFLHLDQDNSSNALNLNEAMAQHRQLLFVGPSGYGKTTLCHYLASKAASFTSNFENETFPLYIPLKLLNHTQDIDVLEATATINTILNLILPKHIVASKKAKLALEQKLKTGQCLLLFDGLDDIVDDDVSKHWLELINQFSRTYSNNYIVITGNSYSIQQHYDSKEGMVLKTFTAYRLMPFSKHDIESYVGKHFDYLYESLALNKGLETNVSPDGFTQQVQNNFAIAELCQNPMMLCMMVALYTDKVVLETDAAVLFNSYIRQSLEWYSPQSCNEPEWQFVLERIAYTMQKNNAPYIFENWCKKVLMSEFDSFGLSLNPDDFDSLLKACRSQQSIFRSIEPYKKEKFSDNHNHIFEFSHKSFQDFLTAKQIQHKAQEGLTLVKNSSLKKWHQGELSILVFYTMLSKATTPNHSVKADEIIHWLLSLNEQEALFCASELALYSNAVSNIAIERIQDELEGILAFENDYPKTKADVLLEQLSEKYRITNEVLLTHS